MGLLHKYQINNIMIDNNMSTKWNYGKETTLQSKKLVSRLKFFEKKL
jgi:hypothetical protein